MRVLVTGATGFVGSGVLRRIVDDDSREVRAAVREPSLAIPADIDQVLVGDVDGTTDWRQALAAVDTVLHLVARVHVMRESAVDPLAEFRRVNVEGTMNLARQAAAVGAKRFVFLSSVKVNGESGVYTESDPPNPQDPYGVSKSEAETGLRRIASETGMEVVIIRPPLVYGPGVKANFRSLMRAVDRGLPLPLGETRNRRSLVALDNLVDFVITCLDHPAAANETFLIGDGEDLSTTELVRRMAEAMGRKAWLIPVPRALLIGVGALLGRRSMVERLVGSLQVDTSKARRVLGWVPPISVDEGLRRAARPIIRPGTPPRA